MEITEEQPRRSEANRLAALEKRKRLAVAAAAAAPATAFPASGAPTFPAYDTAAAAVEWRLVKCPRIASPSSNSSRSVCENAGERSAHPCGRSRAQQVVSDPYKRCRRTNRWR